ncbi:MAG: MFS transporter [Rubrobacteraceae bacterium]
MRSTTRLALSGLSAIAVAYGFARYGYGLFVPAFREEFGLSTEAVGYISSGAYAAYLFAMVLTGFLVGRTGPRFPVVVGALAAGVGMLLISFSWGVVPLAVGAALAGTSPGFCWAPFSDAVAMLVEKERRNRVLSVVSTGTTFGLILVGPVVVLVSRIGGGSGWRYALALFAVAAFGSALWNLKLLPNEPYRDSGARTDEKLGIGWFLGWKSAPLLGQAFCYGLVAAFYYTYAVDLVRRFGFSEEWGPILWSLVGVAGVTGVLSGDAVSRFGLGHCLAACLLVLAASIGALSVAAGSGLLVAGSALAFGASYMPIAAFLALWSGNVFHERPAMGFSAVLFALALGSISGPAVLGAVAGAISLKAAFWFAASLTVFSVVLKPTSEIRNTTPDGPKPAS